MVGTPPKGLIVTNKLENLIPEEEYGDRIDVREAIRYQEMQGNLYGAAQTRFNVALTLAGAGRLVDARDYAEAARHNFAQFGPAAAAEVERTQRLLAIIEEDLRGGSG